ncbi:dynamin family protein [Sporosarcina trichiuri]|uniref:dynamin family protein n=1 Tax=Sporosarcina trichiuri TaxID=3056445 RepID=UPI0025B57538|nr:dynamin family protein [Sporosarcina sp. 0.2-SM1T-5]WJY26436.1 dynamin family protein [Sporosarcina sp. 0.2-SM1T-5]
MGVELTQFNSWKQLLDTELQAIELQMQELEYQTERQKIARIRSQIHEERFQMIVVGEFSRGKSMFINALMGRQILPSLSRPSTAIRNAIVYSETPYIRLHYVEGTRPPELITEAAFKKLTAPMDPILGDEESEQEYEAASQMIKNIQFAEIGHPLPICREGVTLLDTPGLGDLDANRGAITNELIPDSDVAIFLLSATKALSKSEMSLLQDRLFKNDIQKIFVAINFKDSLMKDGDAQKVYDKVTSDLKGLVPETNIYLISAKEQLNLRRTQNGETVLKLGKPITVWTEEKTGFAELEQDLADFLQYERGAVKLLTPLRKSQRILQDILLNRLPIELNALSRSRNELEEQVSSFQNKLANIHKAGRKAQTVLKETMLAHETTIRQWYLRELDGIMETGIQAFDQSSTADLSEIPQLVDAAMAPEERRLELALKDRKETIMKIAMERAGKLLNAEWERLELDFNTAFGLPALSKAGNSLEAGQEEKKDQGIVFFEEIIDELTWNWHDKSTASKIASGVGVAVTGALYAATLMISGLFELFTGAPSERDRLKSRIHTQLRNDHTQKSETFVREWGSAIDVFTGKYGALIEQQIQSKEEQLQKMLDRAARQDESLEAQADELQKAERSLRESNYRLDDLIQRVTGKEEAYTR